jgi:hypothetical protein
MEKAEKSGQWLVASDQRNSTDHVPVVFNWPLTTDH